MSPIILTGRTVTVISLILPILFFSCTAALVLVPTGAAIETRKEALLNRIALCQDSNGSIFFEPWAGTAGPTAIAILTLQRFDAVNRINLEAAIK